MNYAVISFSFKNSNYNCLVKTLSVVKDHIFKDTYIVGLKEVLNPENNLILFKKINGTVYWRWVDDGNTDLMEKISVQENNFKETELPDDDSAKLWFMLEYGG